MGYGDRAITARRGRRGHELEGKIAELRKELLEPQFRSALDHEVLPERGQEVLAGTAANPVRPAWHAELHGAEGSEVSLRNETDRRRCGSHPIPGRGRREGRKWAVGRERLGEVHGHARVESGIS